MEAENLEDVLYHDLEQTSFTSSTCANSWGAVNAVYAVNSVCLEGTFLTQW